MPQAALLGRPGVLTACPKPHFWAGQERRPRVSVGRAPGPRRPGVDRSPCRRRGRRLCRSGRAPRARLEPRRGGARPAGPRLPAPSKRPRACPAPPSVSAASRLLSPAALPAGGPPFEDSKAAPSKQHAPTPRQQGVRMHSCFPKTKHPKAPHQAACAGGPAPSRVRRVAGFGRGRGCAAGPHAVRCWCNVALTPRAGRGAAPPLPPPGLPTRRAVRRRPRRPPRSPAAFLRRRPAERGRPPRVAARAGPATQIAHGSRTAALRASASLPFLRSLHSSCQPRRVH
jgi:hypothetical protein